METNITSQTQKVLMDSEVLSFAEIQDICASLEQEIAIEKIEIDDKRNNRGCLDNPEVAVALITASSTVLVVLIKSIVKIYEANKIKGLISVETESETVKIEVEGSAKNMGKWIDALRKSSLIKKISLLVSKEKDDEFDI